MSCIVPFLTAGLGFRFLGSAVSVVTYPASNLQDFIVASSPVSKVLLNLRQKRNLKMTIIYI